MKVFENLLHAGARTAERRRGAGAEQQREVAHLMCEEAPIAREPGLPPAPAGRVGADQLADGVAGSSATMPARRRRVASIASWRERTFILRSTLLTCERTVSTETTSSSAIS